MCDELKDGFLCTPVIRCVSSVPCLERVEHRVNFVSFTLINHLWRQHGSWRCVGQYHGELSFIINAHNRDLFRPLGIQCPVRFWNNIHPSLIKVHHHGGGECHVIFFHFPLLS